MPSFQTAAVIGAGVAGLACARDLQAAGVRVTVYEKARGPGGRASTRRMDDLRFDHGAQVLHDPDVLAGTPAADLPRTWTPRGGRPAGYAVPNVAMSAVGRALATGLTVVYGTHVAPLAPQPRPRGGVDLRAATPQVRIPGGRIARADAPHALPAADRVVVAAPAPQAADLLHDVAPSLARAAAGVAFDPCWAVLAAWDAPLWLTMDLHDDPDCDVAWAAAQASRPGREPGERWVLHASTAWSRAHLEDAPEMTARAILRRFAATVAGSDLPQPALLTAHRWRYSEPRDPLPDRTRTEGPIAVCGDWCGGGDGPTRPGLGGAIASGRAAAAALLADG